MIIKGNPELGLQQHQQEAYKAVTKAFNDGNRASVVIPTGCGKSFISLQLMEDNRDKNILFLAPTKPIQAQMYRYIAKYIVGEEPRYKRSARKIAEEHFPNLKILLYPTILRMKNEKMENLNPDIIIMDELHRTGADKWGPKIDDLLNLNPNSKVLGLTATPDRMDDKNVVDELFSGKIDYELSLVEAIRKRIVSPPSYVKCDYALGEQLEGIDSAINNCDNEQEKQELREKLDKMRRIVGRADGIPELFSKYLPKKDGKYIVFCKSKEHMDEMMVKAKEWFHDIDDNPEITSVYTGEGYSNKDNEEAIKQFENSKSEHLKLLFSIDKLNEGLHVEDISGVIMLRPTASRIVYLQQLGRAMSSDTTREKTIIFDLVNNYLKNNLDAEINVGREIGERNKEERNKSNGNEEYSEEYIDIFRIQGETKEFLEILEEVRGILDRSNYLINARKIKRWMEERETSKPPSQHAKDEEEKTLGRALSNIKYQLIGPYENLKTEEAKREYEEEHPELKEVMEIVSWIDDKNVPVYLINARKIKRWMEERETSKPPSQWAKDEEEKTLGNALGYIKYQVIGPYEKLKTEETKRKYEEEHPELKEVMEIVSWIDDKNVPVYLINARKIKKWMEEGETSKPPSQYAKDEEEKTLGKALSYIKRQLIAPYEKLKTEEAKRKYEEEHLGFKEVIEIVSWIDDKNVPAYLINARAIKRWMEERETSKPPSQCAKDEEEKTLGKALSYIKCQVISPYEKLKTEEAKRKYEEEHLGFKEVIEIVSWIDDKNVPVYLINARAIKRWMEERETSKPPSQYAKDEEEKTLGNALSYIKYKLIAPYVKLKTEEAKREYEEEHPEIYEVQEIITEIDMKCGNEKQRQLAELIRQDLEKRKMLEEARVLEKSYEAELEIKKGDKNRKVGVNIGE